MLNEEIRKLKRRIYELEQTLNSINTGKVDALIVKDEKGGTSIRTIESEDEPYRLLVENMSEGVFTLTQQGEFIHCNKRFYEIFQVTAEAIIGKSIFNYIPDKQHELLRHILQESTHHDFKEKFTLELIPGSKKIVIFSTHSIKLGKVDGVSIVTKDITELELEKSKLYKIHGELQLNEFLFRQFAENVNEIFWRATLTMDRIIYVSPAYNEIWGLDRDDLYVNPYAWFDAILPEDQNKVKEHFMDLINRKVKEFSLEYRIRKPDATIRNILVRCSVTKYQDENEIIGIASDITDLKRSEKYLMVQYLISTVLVESSNINDGMAKLLKTICEHLDWDVGKIWLVNQERKSLECISFWAKEHSTFSEFEKKSKIIIENANSGIQKKVLETQKTFWIKDLEAENDFLRKKITQDFGLKSGLFIPILYDTKSLGILELFSVNQRNEDVGITKIFESISNQIGTNLKQLMTAAKLNQSLVEKDAMLKEIYHRVKNNLQVVSSLLNLQARNIQDPVSRSIFEESSTRVKAMGLIHEMLYQSGNLAQIEMCKYLQNLTKSLADIYHIDTSRIKTIVDCDTIFLSIDNAIPCGLIINELISNALKHAFPNERSGEIRVSIKQFNNLITIIVSDNGVGIRNDFELKHSTSLGMQLTYALAKQLSVDIKLDTSSGTTFTLTFSPI